MRFVVSKIYARKTAIDKFPQTSVKLKNGSLSFKNIVFLLAVMKTFLKTFSREKWCLKPIHAVESAALLRIKNQAACPFTHVNS